MGRFLDSFYDSATSGWGRDASKTAASSVLKVTIKGDVATYECPHGAKFTLSVTGGAWTVRGLTCPHGSVFQGTTSPTV